jgi:hypothetical protein
MEQNKIRGLAKSVVLDTGTELTYAERGESNKEVIITTAFYFHTFMPVVEGLAEMYHVYAIVMRDSRPSEEKNPDGSTNWARQWGKDEYDFAVKMGIQKFIHVGKCHGTVPGWYMAKEHPEMLDCFASFYLAPHVLPQSDRQWDTLVETKQQQKLMGLAMRKPQEGLKKKMEELQSLGPNGMNSSPDLMLYGEHPEKIWPDTESLDHDLKNMTVPVGYCFGSNDLVFQDFYQANMYAIMNTRGARAVFLQGECHLMELDCPERVVSEAFDFIDECHKDYYKEITSTPTRTNPITF